MSKSTAAALVAEIQAILAQGAVSELDPPCPTCKHEAYGEQGRARKRRYLAILKLLFEAVAKELGQKETAKINMAGPLMPGSVSMYLDGGVADLTSGTWGSGFYPTSTSDICLRVRRPHESDKPYGLNERVLNCESRESGVPGMWKATAFVVSTENFPIPLEKFADMPALAAEIRGYLDEAQDAPDTTKESENP